VLLNVDGFYDPLVMQIERFVSDGFDRRNAREYLSITDDPCAAVKLCEAGPL
jgi:predicted Rossmann-fold nucleotide-binding protein